jgi:hypothetical protein
MNMYGQPLMNQMNQFSTPTMLGQSQQMYGGLGAKLFQPESQYNAQIISANQQNQMQAEMANAQAKAGMISAGIGAIGSMGAGFLGNAGLFGATTGATGAGFSVGGMTNVGGSKLGAGTIYGAPSNASKVSFR